MVESCENTRRGDVSGANVEAGLWSDVERSGGCEKK